MLDACAASDVQRITFSDAPNVLGLAKWRAIEERYAYGQLRALLATLMQRGEIEPGDPEMHGRVLLAVLSEVAENVARVLGALRKHPAQAKGGGSRQA